MEMSTMKPSATAHLRGGERVLNLIGRADFYQKSQGVLIYIHVYGLPGDNVTDFFALHIHGGESCAGEDFADSMGHYNPENMSHPRHAGDLPPLLSNNGEAYMSVLTNRFSVEEVIGKTLVIHSGTDDFYSQPAGNPGIKIACGIIKRV